MPISSVVVVADSLGIDTAGIQLAFTPGDPYPVEGRLRLYVHDQPLPQPQPPTRVVPAIQNVHLSYGRLGEGQQPPPLEPDEHWLRELSFNVSYVNGSWQVSGNQAHVDVVVRAALRDNTPSGESSEPDDPFVAFVDVQALCIWTTRTFSFWELLRRIPFFRP
jgi:hypothetical protein